MSALKSTTVELVRHACFQVASMLACALLCLAAAQQRPGVDGAWQLETNTDVRLVLTRSSRGLFGEFTTLDGVFRFPVSEGPPGDIRFSFRREDEGIEFRFTLRLSEDGRRLDGPGVWTLRNGQKGPYPLALIRSQ